MSTLIIFLQKAIAQGVAILFGASGEILTEKTGNLNLGVPGLMYIGGISGLIGSFLYENAVAQPVAIVGCIISLVCALAGAALGALESPAEILLRARRIGGSDQSDFGSEAQIADLDGRCGTCFGAARPSGDESRHGCAAARRLFGLKPGTVVFHVDGRVTVGRAAAGIGDECAFRVARDGDVGRAPEKEREEKSGGQRAQMHDETSKESASDIVGKKPAKTAPFVRRLTGPPPAEPDADQLTFRLKSQTAQGMVTPASSAVGQKSCQTSAMTAPSK